MDIGFTDFCILSPAPISLCLHFSLMLLSVVRLQPLGSVYMYTPGNRKPLSWILRIRLVTRAMTCCKGIRFSCNIVTTLYCIRMCVYIYITYVCIYIGMNKQNGDLINKQTY